MMRLAACTHGCSRSFVPGFGDYQCPYAHYQYPYLHYQYPYLHHQYPDLHE
jgi:hypothetical protein